MIMQYLLMSPTMRQTAKFRLHIFADFACNLRCFRLRSVFKCAMTCTYRNTIAGIFRVGIYAQMGLYSLLGMSFIEFDHRSFVAFGKYVNRLRLKIVRNDKKAMTLKWIRSLITAYYLFIAYYGLFKLDFASISHPNWKNLKNHWWKCITVWNVVST